MGLFSKGASGLFASESLIGHLARGAVAIALIAWALAHQETHPSAALLAGLAAMVAMRGCPVCWAVGLVETLAQRLKPTTKAGNPPAR